MRSLMTPPYATVPFQTFEENSSKTLGTTKPSSITAQANTAPEKTTGVTAVLDYYQSRPYATSWAYGSEIFYS